MRAVEKRLARGLRTLRDDLWTGRADPLPPSVWLRWLPHGLVLLASFGLMLINVEYMTGGYRQNENYSLLCSLAQGTAVGLALWRPVPALWLSLTATLVIAMGARSQLLSGQADMSSPWPWGPAMIAAHALVLFLLALRVPARVATQALGLTALVTYVVQGLVGAADHSPTGVVAVALFAGVVLLGIALRGRREARSQLVEQESLTAEERSRRTLLEERNRIARELHDVVAHHMSVISIQAQVAPHLVENPSDELKENLDGIRQNALEALAELRRVLGVLRSENPDDPYGLGAPGAGAAPHAPQPTLDRLGVLIENTRAAGLTVTSQVSGERLPLPPGVELSAYRIVQEALSNVLRHAPGATVRVELTHFPRGLQIRVVNSAPQGTAPPSPGAGHGLLGMRERATMLGGTLMAVETSCGGFTVAAFLPRSATARSATTGAAAAGADDSAPGDRGTPDRGAPDDGSPGRRILDHGSPGPSVLEDLLLTGPTNPTTDPENPTGDTT
ncbi:sensor histidine kinase [Streptomyces sp. MMBL 11-3]|uniref:sensor histidine kinase n=1 Tax=Streptomyces sp. MMBL 11-3 TaxID=3382639 RepID=UPI0039B5B698